MNLRASGREMTPSIPPVPFSVLSMCAAVAGALLLPGRPPGLNVILAAALAGVAFLWATYGHLRATDLLLGVLAFLLVVPFCIRAAEWLLAIDLLIAACVASVAATKAEDAPDVARAPARVALRLPEGIGLVLRPLLQRLRYERVANLLPVARGVLLGAALAVIFGSLFASADRAFAHLARSVLVPEWDLGLLPARIFVAFAIVASAGAYVAASPPFRAAPAFASRGRPEGGVIPRRKLKRVEWLSALLVVDALFASFVLVQVAVLFGGRDHVLETAGLSYAQYAREGFFQLLVVAALTLALVAASIAWSEIASRRDRIALQGLLGSLSALTLVVLASALKRLDLYEQAYGFTRLRLSAHFLILWLAAVFAALIVAGGLWRGRWLPRFLIALTAGAVLAFNALNPDAFIARRSLQRYATSGKIDVSYLGGLSPDAVPELMKLPHPLRTCALAPIAARLGTESSLWSWNASRRHALKALAPLRPSLEPGLASVCT